MIKLIATDMDATFLTDEKTYDVALFKQVAATLKQKGITLVIASGNSVNKLQTRFDDEDLKWLHFAGDNGSMIVQNDKIEAIHTVDKNIAQQLIDYLHQKQGFYCLLTCKSGQSYLIGHAPDYALQAYKRYNLYINYINRVDNMPEEDDIVKIAIYGDYSLQEHKQIVMTLQTLFPMLSIVTSGEQWIDAFNNQSGKGNAIAYFQNKLSISKEETLVFGDSLNDLTMMKQAKYNMVMGNAEDVDLIKACTYQIGTNNEQSVLHVIAQWLEQGEAVFEAYKR